MKFIAVKIWRAIVGLWSWFKRWYKSLYSGRPWYIKILSVIATAVVCFILYLVAVDVNFLWLFGSSPGTAQIMNPITFEASYIYSADDVELGKYFDENRTPVPYDSITPVFFDVLIDTEDERFYSHHGIDWRGLGAAIKDMVLYGRPRGASTITQQLVKNMFRMRSGKEYTTGLLGYLPGMKIVIAKSKEWILASKIEYFYDKRSILEMYANTVDFGSNAYGIKTAAKTYFATTPSRLNVQECATLIGLLKATTAYNPRVNPKNSLRRRNVVLDNMTRLGHLSDSERDSIKTLPIELHFSVESAYDGESLYFRQAVAEELRGWCNANGYNLYRDGLKIYTTLDTRMQRMAEQAVLQRMREVQQRFEEQWGHRDCWVDDKGNVIAGFVEDKARTTEAYRNLLARYPNDLDSVDYYMNLPHKVHLFDYDTDSLSSMMSSMDSIRYMLHFMHAGFIAMEPGTGDVKAWVGDVDFKTWKYDKVRAMHQPGSTFKLMVYTAGIEHGMTPCTRRPDIPFDTILPDENGHPAHWRPGNSSGRFTGVDMSLREAFARSINTVAVRVGMEVGIDKVANTAIAMGIQSPLERTPALTLGASDVNLVELTNCYCTIANDGVHTKPVLVARIVDRDGKVVYDARHDNNNVDRAVEYRTAWLMQQMLIAGRTDAGGTSGGLNAYITTAMYDTDFGGKTGTSNKNADAWFVGVTPRLVCSAWVGGEYRQIHFQNTAAGQGSRTALPIVGTFLRSVMSDPAFKHYHARFGEPKQYINPADYRDCVITRAMLDTIANDSTLNTDSIQLLETDTINNNL
mgnify:CR=1 FL=1